MSSSDAEIRRKIDCVYDSADETARLLPAADDASSHRDRGKSAGSQVGGRKGRRSRDVSRSLSSSVVQNGHYGGVEAIYAKKRRLSFGETSESITLSWNNVNVYVPQQKRKCCGLKRTSDGYKPAKQILRGVSGVVQPGKLVAILGASGAGKSTLLNVLTYRNRGNLIVDGEVLVNGQEIGRGMTSLSAYIQQDDMFIGTLKVREHLWFQAMVRMDKDIPYEARMKRINDVIYELGLKKCANTMIGIPGRVKGISGGEMKRLSFASEVLTNPPVMFCDEPTSGLDSFMAENVISTLQRMAAKGKTILCTIHQPSSQVFALFDKLMLMAEGRVAYLGPAADALHFFTGAGYKCPKNFNPADHYVHTLAIIPGQEVECKKRVAQICDLYESSAHCQEVTALIQQNTNTGFDDYFLEGVDVSNLSPYKASWFKQFYALLWRCWISNARDSSVTNTRFLQTIFIALVIGLVYMGQELNQNGIQNINGALFLFLTQMTFSNCFAVINAFPHEMPIFRREHHNGMYRVDVYFLCKTLAELPTFLALPVVFVGITYWMVGMYPAADKFFIALAVVTLVTNVSTSFGYLISTASSNITVALAMAPPLIVPLMLFGGFFLSNASVPVYFLWLQYISWFKYANEILVVNQWESVATIACDTPVNTTGTDVIDSGRCLASGQAVIENLYFNKHNYALDFSMLVLLMVVFRFLAFLALLARSWKK